MFEKPSAKSFMGDFSLFGYIKNPLGTLRHRITEKLGVQLKEIHLGNAGHLIYYSSYGDLAETDDAVALKLGFLRSLDKSPLSSHHLLGKKLIGPGFIQNREVFGNALVVCLGKKDPAFSAFKTILGVPQLYYYESKDGILCSDRLSCLAKLLDHIELNEEIVPLHFLFRSVPGQMTYYRHIKRLLPGQFIRWKDGQICEQSIQCFQEMQASFSLPGNNLPSPNMLFTNLNDVVGDYINQAKASDRCIANLLSGGVDSTLLQYFANLHQPGAASRSFSYAIKSADFQREVLYAKEASKLLHTDHTFVFFSPDDYAGMLNGAIDILAQPPILETEPAMLAVAEFANRSALPYHYFISGQGADTVFGLSSCTKLKGIEILKHIPGSAGLLRALGKMAFPSKRFSTMFEKGAGILSSAGQADSFYAPANSIAVYADLQSLRKCFGDDVLIKALRYRRDFAENYLESDHYLEKFHIIDLMTDTYELGVQRQQLFLGNGREQLHPFFDDQTLQVAFAFPPDIRYIKGFRPKYLLKDLLDQQTGAAISKRPKGFSVFDDDLHAWMKSGPLRELIENIALPGFIRKVDFESKVKSPDYFLWILLNFDLFRRRCLA